MLSSFIRPELGDRARLHGVGLAPDLGQHPEPVPFGGHLRSLLFSAAVLLVFAPPALAGADLFLVSAGPSGTRGAHLAPSGDVALGYSVFLGGTLYLRALLRAALSQPYVFETAVGAQVWETPRFYGDVGVEWGFAFR